MFTWASSSSCSKLGSTGYTALTPYWDHGVIYYSGYLLDRTFY